MFADEFLSLHGRWEKLINFSFVRSFISNFFFFFFWSSICKHKTAVETSISTDNYEFNSICFSSLKTVVNKNHINVASEISPRFKAKQSRLSVLLHSVLKRIAKILLLHARGEMKHEIYTRWNFLSWTRSTLNAVTSIMINISSLSCQLSVRFAKFLWWKILFSNLHDHGKK